MSHKKSQKLMQTQLSNYFSKPTGSANTPKMPAKRPANDKSDDDGDIWASPVAPSRSATPAAKRKRVVILSDDEESENIADKEHPQTPKTPTANSRPALTPKFRPATSLTESSSKRTPKPSPQPRSTKMSESFIQSFRYDEQDLANDSVSSVTTPAKTPSKNKKKLPDANDAIQEFEHLSYDFLKPEKIMDAAKRRPDHPDYDSRTLYVPEKFMRERTPGHRQWWQLKSQYFDTVLFFKIGKFYELYHMDAVIGAENLNLTYMKGNYAHCGFPEMGFGRMAETLVCKGYKVARVEQTETPAQLEERCKKQGVKDKVVARELCRITTAATRTYSPTEDDDNSVNTGHPDANFLFSICEKKSSEYGLTNTRFGVCFVDCAAGQFYMCEFTDNSNFSTLRTLLAHNQPTQVLHPRNGLSQPTLSVINSILGAVSIEPLLKKREFLQADETIRTLMGTDYLGSNVREWPPALVDTIADVNEPIPKPKSDMELTLSALGGVIWFLKKCLIDVDLVTMRKFELYTPTTILQAVKGLPTADRWSGRRMVIDGCALSSLHLLPPTDPLSRSHDAISKTDKEAQTFSLFNTINRCSTPFGRRLLRQWICAPTCDANTLKQRQEAIQFLCQVDAKSLIETATDLFKKVPDLERLFQRIHTLGLKYRSEKHPDSRAHMFDTRHSARKVRDLCITVDGLELVQRITAFFAKHYRNNYECPTILTECLGDELLDMTADLAHFKKLLANRDQITKEGRIVPKKGMDPDYDNAIEEVEDAETALESYLDQQRKKLRSNQVSYFGTGKNRYQLEIPENLTDDLSHEYELKSKRKGFKRYRTAELEKLIENLAKVEKKRDDITEDSTRRVFADFDKRKEKWARIVNLMAIFDCLLSLASYCSTCALEMCVPEFDFQSDKPYLEIRAGNHPSLASGSGSLSSSEYIPNDTLLGGEFNAAAMLLTGANMSGKSTLMRQTAVLVVLAQLGCMVPASSMRLTPVDRIFCRIGASDSIAAGQSTFFMELNETNVIIREATAHSLVIIDELGRGTSTYDGTAIAQAVLHHIADSIKCRTLFSTHYHSLCEAFKGNANIALAHMACLVENDDEDDDPSMDNITFLYTLASGPSPKSFGFFTARMAGINQVVVRRAYRYSKMLEPGEECLNKLRNLAMAVKENRISDEDLMRAIKAA